VGVVVVAGFPWFWGLFSVLGCFSGLFWGWRWFVVVAGFVFVWVLSRCGSQGVDRVLGGSYRQRVLTLNEVCALFFGFGLGIWMVQVCPFCGRRIADEDVVCPFCGGLLV